MRIIKPYIIFFSLFLPTIAFSQTKLIDSLENKLQNHKAIDTIRIELLNTLAFKYYNIHDITKAEGFAVEANALSKKLNFKKGEAKSAYVFCKIHMKKSENDKATTDCLHALKLYKEVGNKYAVSSTYNILGSISIYKNDPDKALDYFTKALDVAKEIGNVKRQSAMIINIGNISYTKGNLDEAINYYKQSMALNESIGDIDAYRATSNNIAVIYVKQGRPIEALEYLKKNLALSKEDNNKEELATATSNIGALYFEMEQYEKGLEYTEEALRLNKELNDKREIAKNLVSIGGAYAALNEHKKALSFFKEGLTLNKAIENKYGLVICLNHIGGLNLRMNQPDKALANFKKCLEISESLENKLHICYSHISLAEAYLVKKNYSKALFHAHKGEKLASELELMQEQKSANDILSSIYEVNGKYKESLNYHKKYKTISDSLFNKKNIEKIAQLEYEYKYKQAIDSANIRELQLTKTVKATSQDLEKSQRNLFLGVIAFLAMLLILGTIIFFLKLRNEKSKTQNIAIEQKLLRSQMTPHFIFNSLSVLQGMILNKEDSKAVYYLSKFSKLLRITLENSRDKTVPLHQELEAINNYLELQNLEESQAYQYTVLVDETIDETLFEIPTMLIQPFIENAIQHGFKKIKDDRKIDVKLKYQNEELICTITDNGIGIDAPNGNKKKDKKSLATTITSERLKVLSKDFKIKGSVHIEDRKKYNEQGTIVTLVIPYKLQEIKKQ